MKNQEAAELLDKYFAGTCTPEEYQMVIRAYNMEIPIYAIEPTAEEYETSKKLVLNRLQREHPEIRTSIKKIWRRITAIAAAVTALAVCIYFFKAPGDLRTASEIQSASSIQDVGPGKNTARLTLANGKTIILSDQKTGIVIGDNLMYDDKTLVASKEELELLNTTLTASTPRGGTYEFTLPDSTRVWLNAESRISFPYRFSGDYRTITLEGEAYLEVAKNKLNPFVVKTRGQEIVVLGTHFNVKCYADEPEVKTTLLEGSIRITPNGHSSKMLKPGEQAVVTERGLRVVNANPDMAIAWKNGDFFFNGQDIEEVMRTVSRWYDIKVEYKSKPKNIYLEGEVSRSKKLSTILKVLEETSDSKFIIVDRKVIVEQ